MNPLSNSKNPDENPPITQNYQSNKNSYSSSNDLPLTYDRQIAHAAEIKLVNDRYVTPVTVEFVNSDSDNYVNLPVKRRKLFAALKLLDPSISTNINDTTINHSREFPVGTVYTDTFDVITDKKITFSSFFFSSRTPFENPSIRSYIQQTQYHANSTVSQQLANLQQIFYPPRSKYRLPKYISTSLTLQYIANKRVTPTLAKVDLTEEEIIALQQNTENDVNNTQNNRRKPDGQLKDVTESQQRNVSLAFDLSTKRIRFGNSSKKVTTITYEIKFHPAYSTMLKSPQRYLHHIQQVIKFRQIIKQFRQKI